MAALLYVGAGGFLGSICRYLLSMIPVHGDFPFMTFVTNFFGAILIGIITGFATQETLHLAPQFLLLMKTGFCGGFTTFSTFSLETATLFENDKYAMGTVYALASVVLCVLGIYIGKTIVRIIGMAIH